MRRGIAAAGGITAVAVAGALGSAGAAQDAGGAMRTAASAEPSLTLTVRPHSVAVGRRTTFRFHVTRPDGKPVRRARVTLAGDSARTGRRGRARIVATLHRKGRFTARATKHGFRSASAVVRAHPRRPIGFDGTCEFSGSVKFDPPLTNDPQPITQHVRGAGTCSGTLVDRRGRKHEVEDEPTVYVAVEKGDQVSCGGGTDAGSGALVFKAGRLDFTVQESRAGALAVLQAQGRSSGSATITGNVSPEEDPVDIQQKCAAGGLESVKLDGNVSTNGTIAG